jgi:hypothetical protein
LRIELRIDGGLAPMPGLQQAARIDTAELPSGERATLEALVEAADFFKRPVKVSTHPPGAADFRSYVITVEDGDRSHTVRVDEPVEDQELSNLIRTLRRHRLGP